MARTDGEHIDSGSPKHEGLPDDRDDNPSHEGRPRLCDVVTKQRLAEEAVVEAVLNRAGNQESCSAKRQIRAVAQCSPKRRSRSEGSACKLALEPDARPPSPAPSAGSA
jgi:hypothetical protein